MSYKAFSSKQIQKFIKKISKILSSETILIIGLPHSGQTTLLRSIEDRYTHDTKDNDTIILYFEVIDSKISLNNLSQKILESLKYKLHFPNYLEEVTCEDAIKEIINRKLKLLFIINRFQNLKTNKKVLTYLQTLRAINPLSIRFLLSSDISYLTNPQQFNSAGMLASSNIFAVPLLDKKGIQNAIKYFKRYYGWNIQQLLVDKIYNLSGGISGLVKYLIKYAYETEDNSFKIEKVLKYHSLKYKIEEIYEKLKENKLIKNNRLDIKQSKILQNMGVLDKEDKSRIHLLSPLLSKKYKKESKVNFRKILSKQECDLFAYFRSKLEDLITIDEISGILWSEKELEKYSQWAIYKSISNLNKKIKPFGFYIKNYRGRGYSLKKE